MVEQTEAQTPTRLRLGVVIHALCLIPSGIERNCKVQPVGNGEQDADEPHGQAADLHHPRILPGVHLHRVNDGHVAVDTDAGQEKDPTVEVDLYTQG